MTSLTHSPHRRVAFLKRPGSALWLEGGTLLAAAPFLLFPTFNLPLTALALAALGSVWLWSAISRQENLLRATPIHLAMLPFAAAVGVGILVSADPAQTLPKATGVLLGFGIWRIISALAVDPRQAARALALFLVLGASLAVMGFLGLQTIPKVPLLTALAPGQYWTAPAWLALETHPNQLAGLVCLLLPVVVALLAQPAAGPRWRRPALGGLLLLFLAILALTQSRGGWIGAAVGLLALIALWSATTPPSPARRVTRILLVVGLILGGLGLAALGPARIQTLWLEPPDETAVGSLTTLNFRRELWPQAIQAAKDFWLTGIGLGSFREAAFRLYALPVDSRIDVGHAHNVFLQISLDTGIPGLVSYLGLLGAGAAAALWVARVDNRWRFAALGLLAGLIAFHVFGMADTVALGAKPGIIFWYAFGLLSALANLARMRAGEADRLAEV